MPVNTIYVCLKCQHDFNVPIYSVEEQKEEVRRDPSMSFGKANCPRCDSFDVLEQAKLVA
ncbi:hypothetical protein D1224_08450 [Henriciella barbarensis]|uniref:Zinc ribbon domain-containing protein n=1 Tax=Henriciella barbarensis TaxID=86342 RepID=A0A399QZF8_9PROT|nr:hypothetical protein D1224_08450 [Henriciella barbarensis]